MTGSLDDRFEPAPEDRCPKCGNGPLCEAEKEIGACVCCQIGHKWITVKQYPSGDQQCRDCGASRTKTENGRYDW